MSVIIKGIAMPKDCSECPCHDGYDGWCRVIHMSTDYIPRACPMFQIEDESEENEDAEIH